MKTVKTIWFLKKKFHLDCQKMLGEISASQVNELFIRLRSSYLSSKRPCLLLSCFFSFSTFSAREVSGFSNDSKYYFQNFAPVLEGPGLWDLIAYWNKRVPHYYTIYAQRCCPKQETLSIMSFQNSDSSVDIFPSFPFFSSLSSIQ